MYENLTVETAVAFGDERIVLITAGAALALGVSCNFSEAMTADVDVRA